MKKIIFLMVILSMFAFPVYGAISQASVVTNISSSDRVIMGTNSTLNITFTESVGTNYTNLTFPAQFNMSNLEIVNVTNNTGATLMTINANMVNFTYAGIAPGVIYFNFTSNLKSPPTSGAYAITIKTNATLTPTTVYVCARDSSRPYLVSTNNSVFTTTCGTPTETFGTGTTSVTLTGTGIANLTFFTPSISGQTNIIQGYGATNASHIKNTNASGNGSVITYVVTKSTISNPVITVSSASELSSSNLPLAVIGSVISGAVILYVVRRRRH